MSAAKQNRAGTVKTQERDSSSVESLKAPIESSQKQLNPARKQD
jgi:hypothetical protein